MPTTKSSVTKTSASSVRFLRFFQQQKITANTRRKVTATPAADRAEALSERINDQKDGEL